MKKRYFRLNWKTGKPELINGPDLENQRETLANAMNNAGIGHGPLPALDSWEEITKEEYEVENVQFWCSAFE